MVTILTRLTTVIVSQYIYLNIYIHIYSHIYIYIYIYRERERERERESLCCISETNMPYASLLLFNY